jgi:hypothetical protein
VAGLLLNKKKITRHELGKNQLTFTYKRIWGRGTRFSFESQFHFSLLYSGMSRYSDPALVVTSKQIRRITESEDNFKILKI